MVSSDPISRDKELWRISTAMAWNGYPKKFVDKAINRQMRRPSMRQTSQSEEDQPKPQIARIPYIDGLSQEVRRIASVANVRCVFNMPRTLQHLYNVKDRLAEDTVRNAVYSIKCKTCKMEYIGETQRAIGCPEKGTPERCTAGELFQVCDCRARPQ